MELMLWNIGDAREHVGEPCLGIDVVEPGGGDEAEHERGALSSAIGAGEEPGLSAQGDAAQGALRAVVRQTDAAVLEEGCERISVAQHVVHGLGDI